MKNRIFCTFLLLFGVLSIKESSAVLFFSAVAQEEAGQVVSFILWFNFVAGFLYIVTSIFGLLKKPITLNLAKLITTGTAITWLALIVHIFLGNPYELRTLIAHSLRLAIWGAAILIFSKTLKKKEPSV